MRPWLILTNDFSGNLFTRLGIGIFATPILLTSKIGVQVLLNILKQAFTIRGLPLPFAIMHIGVACIHKRSIKIKHWLLGSLMLADTGLIFG